MKSLPTWDFDNSYKDIDSPAYKAELEAVDRGLRELACGDIKSMLENYEETKMRLDSLKLFVKCKGAVDNKDLRVNEARGLLIDKDLCLQERAKRLFKKLGTLKNDDKLWENELFKAYKYKIACMKNSYLEKIEPHKKEILNELSKTSFYPISWLFGETNKLMDFKINGKDVGVGAATAMMKGAGTKEERRQNYENMCRFYSTHAHIYASTLSALHGFNLVRIKEAGVGILSPGLEINHMSEESLQAMFTTIKKHVVDIRKSVLLRTPYLGEKIMPAYELNAGMPRLEGEEKSYSYEEGLGIIKDALRGLDESVPLFIDKMHEKGLVDASRSDSKIGGAFCENFTFLKEQRIFSTYTGSFSSLSTQAHELGHAWHYHLLEGLPSVLSDVPMSLAESASTFNEALLREYMLKNSKDEKLHFEILWQELRAVANFLLHIPARFGFETRFLKARSEHVVGAKEAVQMMDEAWEEYFGKSASSESYLWCFKLHFYKTDQFLYNFPYTVGYLVSQALMQLKNELGKDFFKAYVAFLKDSACMSVDDVIKKHLGYDIKKPEFWEAGVKRGMEYVRLFENEFKI